MAEALSGTRQQLAGNWALVKCLLFLVGSGWLVEASASEWDEYRHGGVDGSRLGDEDSWKLLVVDKNSPAGLDVVTAPSVSTTRTLPPTKPTPSAVRGEGVV